MDLVPEEVLTFDLKNEVSPKVVLRVSNTSSGRIAFKVKTTQPTWYFVRPNQQMLDVGQTEEVSIALVDTECSRVLKNYGRDGRTEKLDKHRFLVQTRHLADEDFERISACAPSEKHDELAKIWNSGTTSTKDDKRNHKLYVRYDYPSAHEMASTTDAAETGGVDSAKTRTSSTAASGEKEAVGEQSAEEVSELEALKSKYDAIVEYTVHLTAERDMIVTQLELMKKEYNSELKQSKKAEKKTAEVEKEPETKMAKGYSFMVVLLVALISFALGRFLIHI